jgi:hypothetical protein
VLKPSGIAGRAVTVVFSDSTIDMTVDGTVYEIPVPDGTITFSPQATTATTDYNWSTKTWQTVVPSSVTGNVFVTGLPIYVPFDLPGSITGVKWSAHVTTLTPGVSLDWRWAAAVYKTYYYGSFRYTDVKPIDGAGDVYPDNELAGTPENSKRYVIRGARGDGGKNYTGTLTSSASRCQF